MRSTDRSLSARVEACLRQTEVGPGTPILAACSGGPDSTALVILLNQIQPVLGFTLRTAYYDHGLQPPEEAALEKRAVEDFCGRLGLDLYLGRAERGTIQAESREEKLSLEETARNHRREFLLQTLAKSGCVYLALGHTADDQVETVVMRVFQGSGVRGLVGMRRRSGPILRPLLEIQKRELLQYLEQTGYAFHLDRTNSEDHFLRGRLRKSLMPALEEVFPAYQSGLADLSRKMGDVAELMDDLLSHVDTEISGDSIRLPVTHFRSLPRTMRFELLLQAWDRIRGGGRPGRRLPHRFLTPIVDAQRLSVNGHGIMVEALGDYLLVRRDVVSKIKKGYVVHLGGLQERTLVTESLHIVLSRLRKAVLLAVVGAPDGSLCVSQGAVDPPLILRSRTDGDTLGHRSIKKILIDWDVPRPVRNLIPVLADRKGVAAILGASFGFQNLTRHGLEGTPNDTQYLLTVRARS